MRRRCPSRAVAPTAASRAGGPGGRWWPLAALTLLAVLAAWPGAGAATGGETYDVVGASNQTNGGYGLNDGDTLRVGVAQNGGIHANPAIIIGNGKTGINVVVYGPDAAHPGNTGIGLDPVNPNDVIIGVVGENSRIVLQNLQGTTAVTNNVGLVIYDNGVGSQYILDHTTLKSTADAMLWAPSGSGLSLSATNGSFIQSTAGGKNVIDTNQSNIKLTITGGSRVESAQTGIYANGANAKITFDHATAQVGAKVVDLGGGANDSVVTVSDSGFESYESIANSSANDTKMSFANSQLTTTNGDGFRLNGAQNSLTLRGTAANVATEADGKNGVKIGGAGAVVRVLDGATLKSERADAIGVLNFGGADATIVVAGRGRNAGEGAVRRAAVMGGKYGIRVTDDDINIGNVATHTLVAVGKHAQVAATQDGGVAICVNSHEGSVNVSGTVRGVANSVLLDGGAPDDVVVNLMDGAVIDPSANGLQHNFFGSDGYLTFGYAPGTDPNAGDWWAAAGTGSGAGKLEQVNNAAVVTVKDKITGYAEGDDPTKNRWIAYFAAGTADLRADAIVREAHVGAAGFEEKQLTLPDSHTATRIVAVPGAEALVKVARGATFTVHEALRINSGGTLEVNGALTLDDPVGLRLMGGTLRGGGTVTSDVVASGDGGVIAAGGADRTGTLTFAGDLTLGAGVALATRVGDVGADLIKVEGAGGLTLAANSQVKVTVTGAGLRPGDRRVVVVAANGITDHGAIKTVPDAVLVSFALDIGATEIVLNTHAKIKAIQNALAIVGDEADAPLAATLDAMIHNPPRALDGVYAALYRLGTAEAVARAVRELNAVGAAAAGSGMRAVRQDGGAIGKFFGDAFFRDFALAAYSAHRAAGRWVDPDEPAAPKKDPALDRAQAGGAPGAASVALADAPAPRWEGFLMALGGFGSQASRVDVAGYDQRSIGLLAGMERRFDRFAFGGQFSWARHHADVALGLGEMDDNVLRFGPYARYQSDNFYALTAPGVGLHLLESKRNVNFMGLTAKGERTGMDFSWLNQAGFAFSLPGGFCASPSASLAFSYLHDPDFAETGAGAVGLRTAAADYFSLGSTLAFRLGRPIELGGTTILPEVWAGWEHEYLESGNIHCEFIGAPGASWQVPVDDIAADRAVLGAGLSTLMGDRWEAAARYEGRLWEGGCNHAFALTLSAKF